MNTATKEIKYPAGDPRNDPVEATCQQCGKQWIIRVQDTKGDRRCPKCGSTYVRTMRVISAERRAEEERVRSEAEIAYKRTQVAKSVVAGVEQKRREREVIEWAGYPMLETKDGHMIAYTGLPNDSWCEIEDQIADGLQEGEFANGMYWRALI